MINPKTNTMSQPSDIAEELSGTLALLLSRYLQLLTEDHGDFWSRQ